MSGLPKNLQTAEGVLAAAQEAHSVAQRRLQCAHGDLEKRIHEHDTCVAEGRASSLTAVTLQMIKEQEATVAKVAQEAKVRPRLAAPVQLMLGICSPDKADLADTYVYTSVRRQFALPVAYSVTVFHWCGTLHQHQGE